MNELKTTERDLKGGQNYATEIHNCWHWSSYTVPF